MSLVLKRRKVVVMIGCDKKREASSVEGNSQQL
jgi:hypothetical protein